MFSRSCVMEAQCSNKWSHCSQTVQENFLSLASACKYRVGIGLKLPLDISTNCIFKVKYTAYWEIFLAWKQIVYAKILLQQKVALENSRTVGAHYTAMWLAESKMTRWRLDTTLFIPSIWLITEFGRCGEVSWRLTWKRKTLFSCYLTCCSSETNDNGTVEMQGMRFGNCTVRRHFRYGCNRLNCCRFAKLQCKI